MRILLGHNSTYYPPQGGGDKSNRLLMEALVSRGHSVRVVTRVERFGPEAHQNLLDFLRKRNISPTVSSGAVRFPLKEVDVHTLTLDSHMRSYFTTQVNEFDPDIIVISTDDPAHLLLEPALAAARARVVYLVRATIAVPFGPESSAQSAEKTQRMRQVDGMVGVSEAVARYVREWGGMEAVHLPISLMEGGEPPCLGRFENPFVTMVNPCAVKGISIFTAVAARMPDVSFAAVPTWGTNDGDLAALRARTNITILKPVENIDDLLKLTRIMLVPSVWAEARSRIVLESMSRGIPVVASAVGGIPEAMMGVDYLIPVNVIKHYRPQLDSRLVPVAEAPSQNLEPWVDAVRRLSTDRDHYEQLAGQSRKAALGYIENLTARPFEDFLLRILHKPRPPRSYAPSAKLSPERKQLLALRVRQTAELKRQTHYASLWFPRCGTGFRLFCFPHAGAGTLSYRNWGPHVCPVALPGRESRSSEPSFERMESLIEALATAIVPLLNQPFALFGHSMGAGVAFELTRALRRADRPSPRALFVSSARAPHLRRTPPDAPDPSDTELLVQLRQMGGFPDGEERAELIQLAMPALRADTRLYRCYVYQKEAPLDIPIFAYHGLQDPTLASEHVAAWRKETTGSFHFREFPGGHFYLHNEASGFMETFRADQGEVIGDSRSDSTS